MNSTPSESNPDKMAADFVGEVLREQREACNKTQDDVASGADLSRNGVHKIETGGSDPSLRNVERMAECTNSTLMITVARAEQKARKK